LSLAGTADTLLQVMPQDKETGATANRFGRENAARVAKKIGAQLIDQRISNEASFEGKRTVIKSAKMKTPYIGVLYKVLARVQSVIAAIEVERNSYTILELSAEKFGEVQRPRTCNPATGLVHRRAFLAEGRQLGQFTL
jgi:hypothetical protein